MSARLTLRSLKVVSAFNCNPRTKHKLFGKPILPTCAQLPQPFRSAVRTVWSDSRFVDFERVSPYLPNGCDTVAIVRKPTVPKRGLHDASADKFGLSLVGITSKASKRRDCCIYVRHDWKRDATTVARCIVYDLGEVCARKVPGPLHIKHLQTGLAHSWVQPGISLALRYPHKTSRQMLFRSPFRIWCDCFSYAKRSSWIWHGATPFNKLS